MLCLFSRVFEAAFGDLERVVLLRFLDRLLDLYFFNFPFLRVRDLESDLLLDRRLGDSDLRFLEVDLDLDLLRETERFLDNDRLLERDLLLGDLRRDRDNDRRDTDLPPVFEYERRSLDHDPCSRNLDLLLDRNLE